MRDGKIFIKNVLCEKLIEKDIKVVSINAWEIDCFNNTIKYLIEKISENSLNIPTEAIEKVNAVLEIIIINKSKNIT